MAPPNRAPSGPARSRPPATTRARPKAGPLLGGLAAVLVLVVGGISVYVFAQNRSSLPAPVVTAPLPPLLPGAPVLKTPDPAPPATVPVLGFDVSYPQCARVLPTTGGYAIVGINGGRPLSTNQCLTKQMRWASTKAGRAVYINTGYPGTGDPVGYGRRLVDDAIAREHASGATTTVWWLDVETVNTWEGSQRENATVLDSMAAHLQDLGVRVGIYSTPSMWLEIAGTWEPGLPVWYATGPGTQAKAAPACDKTFAGSATAIVQWVQSAPGGALDHNLICPAFADRARELLELP